MIEIFDFTEARALVAEGDTTADEIGDIHSACLFRDALQERLDALGDCTSCDAIELGKFLVDQLAELECDWMDPPSPECEAHLY